MAREFATRVVCPHGKAVILMGAEPEDIQESADDLIDAIKHGMKVERCTVAEARTTPFGCDPCRKERHGA